MKESTYKSYEIDDIKRAMHKMYDALGVNYTTISEVYEKLDEMASDLKPSKKTLEVIKSFKTKHENLGAEGNPLEFWALQAKDISNVVEAVRLYMEANTQQLIGCDIIKNRILFLANQGKWA